MSFPELSLGDILYSSAGMQPQDNSTLSMFNSEVYIPLYSIGPVPVHVLTPQRNHVKRYRNNVAVLIRSSFDSPRLRNAPHLGSSWCPHPARTWHGDCLDTSISAFGRFQHPAEKISTIGIDWYKKRLQVPSTCAIFKVSCCKFVIYHGQEQYLRDG